MDLKKIVKNGFILFAILVIIYYVKLPKLEFWVYHNFTMLLAALVSLLFLLIAVLVLLKFYKPIAGFVSGCYKKFCLVIKNFYDSTHKHYEPLRQASTMNMYRIYKNVEGGYEDLIDPAVYLKTKRYLANYRKMASRTVRQKSFKYKAAGLVLLNLIVVWLLVKGWSTKNVLPIVLLLSFAVLATYFISTRT